jgi:DNA-binding CsgD family transcriptional regulator
MHFVQTAWLADRQNQRDFTGGWPAAKFHLYSWALSAHCLARHSPQLTLVADSAAADLLVGQMQLPYSRVDLALDTFDNPFPLLWVLKKNLAYARQPGPFAHVDSDAYLFYALSQAPLFAQNLEFDHPYYLEAGAWVGQQFNDLSAWARPQADGHVWAVNAGLIGGTDHRFYQEFHGQLLVWLARNEAQLSQVPNWDYFNTYVEQATIVGYARSRGLDFAGLLPQAIGYPYTYELDQFWRLPNRCSYLHAMNYKQNPAFCEQLAQRLRLEAPELYERANTVARGLAATSVAVPEVAPPMASGEDPAPPPGAGEVLADQLAHAQGWAEACTQGQAYLARPGAWRATEQAADRFWATVGEGLGAALVRPGPLFAPVECQWNWAEANEFAQQRQPRTLAPPPANLDAKMFTERELEVLLQLAHGQTRSQAIGETLHLSPRTVDTHKDHLMEKLGINCRDRLYWFAGHKQAAIFNLAKLMIPGQLGKLPTKIGELPS